ncbi:TPA: DNA-packaging protein FI [Klebsiella aerogenes]|uniref:DNA-packaging protein FI n=1 Tax=Klebsiella aerogenes TaxID=548 RepID=UPI00186790BB|nr:DNA-packaging protein FI [Klebsiella aerogenes]ELA2475814.1 DNA-packaging protein FI [Klebsiella aerogenes]HBR0006142.1 DNA-packaging protein FI [Klebsiella aerogenes]HDT0084941.1 DNA-packaging protein FI [Klebsiella aerogenes]HDT1803423.1 DNA-packaging protein FI [Klebsiella aerogenes]HDT4321896.1 DNA-packaging protein FI [Klebsiella aerogenes]
MTKEELIARLKELGSMLNREVSLTGSKEELALRVAELEEELGDDIDDGGDSDETGTGNAASGSEEKDSDAQGNALTPAPKETKFASDDLVAVKTLTTLHLEALHAVKNEKLSLVLPGTTVRVSAGDAEELITRGLAVEL